MNNPCSVELLESALVGELPPEREDFLHRHMRECEALRHGPGTNGRR